MTHIAAVADKKIKCVLYTCGVVLPLSPWFKLNRSPA